MTRLLVTEGIVLKKKQLLGRDAVVTVFTQDLGKISAIAKGIKSITSRRAPHMQTANVVEVELAKFGDAYYLRQSKLISALSSIKNHEEKTSQVYSALLALDKLLALDLCEALLYKKTRRYLVELANASKCDSAQLCIYLNQMLQSLGFSDRSLNLSEVWATIEELTS